MKKLNIRKIFEDEINKLGFDKEKRVFKYTTKIKLQKLPLIK